MQDIRILQLSQGARLAKGLTVIIDVFRAFTTACQLIENGARRIIPIARLDDARLIKLRNSDFVLIGERKGIKLPDAAYGNSPSEIARADFSGKTILFTTSAGTQGFVNADCAEQLITGSLVNADAIISYILKANPSTISLVCMGFRDRQPSDEDTLCAEYIKNGIAGEKYSQAHITQTLKASPFSAKFFDPEDTRAPEEDFSRCIALNSFNFILKLEPQADGFKALIPEYREA